MRDPRGNTEVSVARRTELRMRELDRRNAAARDAVGQLANGPMASLFQTVAQPLANGANTCILWDQALLDTHKAWAVNGDRTAWFAPISGYYGISGSVISISSAKKTCWLTVNGVPVPASTGMTQSSSFTDIYPVTPYKVVALAAGDWVQLWAWQNAANISTWVRPSGDTTGTGTGLDIAYLRPLPAAADDIGTT